MRNWRHAKSSKRNALWRLAASRGRLGTTAAVVTSFAMLVFSVFVLCYVFFLVPDSIPRSDRERSRQIFFEKLEHYLAVEGDHSSTPAEDLRLIFESVDRESGGELSQLGYLGLLEDFYASVLSDQTRV